MNRASIVGDNIYLKPVDVTELTDDFLDWLDHLAINTFIPTKKIPLSRKSIESRVEDIQGDNVALYGIFDLAHNNHIGNARICDIDWIHRAAVYDKLIVSPEHVDFGSECLILLMRHAFHFLGMNRMWASLRVDDAAELSDQDKIGISRECIMRQAAFRNGCFVDGVVMAMIREDFDKIHGSPAEWPEGGGLTRSLPIK
jgi:[ribosomal protein S5]-alanine N-acetyltransferase